MQLKSTITRIGQRRRHQFGQESRKTGEYSHERQQRVGQAVEIVLYGRGVTREETAI